ncbi:ABC-type amino acid transport/signal transduction system [Pseudoalteromonas luteoviolacea B = ATCC 29581]|nr:ABC-type amino acid transport/signal transduction system [Pseudoalteromonas luteoviolacea B = ATCC 29581]
MRSFLLTLMFVLSLFFTAMALAIDIKFCYEDKALPPMFTGTGMDVPEKSPGASIEILQQVEQALSSVRFNFIRKPWKRCLADLKQNKAHAVIASFREERLEYMAYPLNSSGQIDFSKAISQFGSCLVGKPLRLKSAFLPENTSVALPNGYSIVKLLESQGYQVVTTYSQRDAYELVLNDLVDATVGVCEIGDEPVNGFLHAETLVAKYPPIETNFGFIAFSNSFYHENEQEVLEIWDYLSTMPSSPVYLKYIMSGLEE